MAEESPASVPLCGVETHGGAQVSHIFHKNHLRPFRGIQTWILFYFALHDFLFRNRRVKISYGLFLCIRSYTDEWGPKHWPPSRFNHVMKLRQAALKAARERWADYILVRLR